MGLLCWPNLKPDHIHITQLRQQNSWDHSNHHVNFNFSQYRALLLIDPCSNSTPFSRLQKFSKTSPLIHHQPSTKILSAASALSMLQSCLSHVITDPFALPEKNHLTLIGSFHFITVVVSPGWTASSPKTKHWFAFRAYILCVVFFLKVFVFMSILCHLLLKWMN